MIKKDNSSAVNANGRPSGSDTASKIVEIKLSDITVDQKYQIRENGLDEATVKEYQAIYEESPNSMEPVVCVRIDNVHCLVAGFQRREAASRAGRETIRAKVIDGDEKTAFREALSSNKHGLKLSNGDMKKAILIAVDKLPDLPNTKIASMVGCVESYVRKVKKEDAQSRTSATPDGADKAEKSNAVEKKKSPAEKAASKSDDSPGDKKEPSAEVDVSVNHASDGGESHKGDDVDRVETLLSHIVETAQKFSEDEKKRLYDSMCDMLIKEGYRARNTSICVTAESLPLKN